MAQGRTATEALEIARDVARKLIEAKAQRSAGDLNLTVILYNFINSMSDLSPVFRPVDILGIPQAIKGFDKSDFGEVFSIIYN